MQRYESHQADAQVNLPHRVTLQSVCHASLAGPDPFTSGIAQAPCRRKRVWDLAYTEVVQASYGDYRLTPLIVLLAKCW